MHREDYANKNQTRKMTSIARRINTGFWLKSLFSILWLDILIAVLVCATYLYWCNEQLPVDVFFLDYDAYIRGLEGSCYADLQYVIKLPDGAVYAFFVHDFFDYVIMPAIILIIAEVVHLFFALFHTGEIRRKLKPLNDLAIKTQQLSRMPLDSASLEHLEEAIARISPDSPDARIQTGDKDLQSIEVALNNLLYRMKESQKQQSRFVSDASHELRTPISVIQGYVNMLDRWGKEDESVLEESIEALKMESEHMKELIEQLLFLARGDSGRNTLKLVDFDLTGVMTEVWEESLMIDEKHSYVFKETGPHVMHGDVAMVKQSIRIFVQNAAKYSNDGDKITLAVNETEEAISYIVQDEGIGMQESDVVHIFERFYRSDEARNGETGGSGLGLSIAKWIIDAHNGTIEVLSRPEFGTRFTVNFMKNNSW